MLYSSGRDTVVTVTWFDSNLHKYMKHFQPIPLRIPVLEVNGKRGKLCDKGTTVAEATQQNPRCKTPTCWCRGLGPQKNGTTEIRGAITHQFFANYFGVKALDYLDFTNYRGTLRSWKTRMKLGHGWSSRKRRHKFSLVYFLGIFRALTKKTVTFHGESWLVHAGLLILASYNSRQKWVGQSLM